MLFSEIKIKDYVFKNRLVMPPMCMYQADSLGHANDFHFTHYTSRAIGGVGAIILEATGVEARGRITEHDLGIYSDDHIAGLKNIVQGVKKYNCIIGIQLGHAGRKSQTRSEIIAPSSIAFPKMKEPKAMSIDDIQNVILAFKSAAIRANEAGFDFIEIHAAHGYLINQFLSPLTNQRTDHYGGSIENRLRFLSEIIDEIKEVWPDNKLLGIRFSAEEYAEGGNHVEDICYIINYLKAKQIDFIDVSSGGVVPAQFSIYPGYQLNLAKTIKEKTDLCVIGGGLVTSVELAEYAVSGLGLDFVYVGRELLRNPYFPLQVAKALNVDVEWHPSYIRAK